jgi:hypothetical protein
MNRHKQAEALASTVRAEIPRVAVQWLAAARAPLEKLTTAALDPNLSDEDLLSQIDAFIKKLPELMDELDHDALAKLMENGMGAAMGNGIAKRMEP